jgi:hypothetical protein
VIFFEEFPDPDPLAGCCWNSKLEQQVDELSASYDQLAQNYGVSSGFKVGPKTLDPKL